jgi:hypothetical protein
MVVFDPETISHHRRHGLIVILHKQSGGEVARCKLCWLGYVGENAVQRVRKHIKQCHSRDSRKAARKYDKFDSVFGCPGAEQNGCGASP